MGIIDYHKGISTGYCTKENHNKKFEFYCKTHNQLVCDACICEIKTKGKGQHKICDVCNIEEIEAKIKKFNQNCKYIKDKAFEKINKLYEIDTYYEELKIEKKKFKNLRKMYDYLILFDESWSEAINNREKNLIEQIDIVFNNLFCKEEYNQQRENLYKILLKSYIIISRIDNVYYETRLILDNYINLENYIYDIKIINDYLNVIIKKFYSTKIEVKFSTGYFNDLEDINDFGEIIIERDNNVSIFLKMIKNRIEEFNNKKITYRLIYDAEIDGQSQKIYNSKCNYIPNTFIVTTNNNNKFCFFRSTYMNQNGIRSDDKKAFFFSYDKDNIYKIKKSINDISPYLDIYGFTLSENIFNDKCFCLDKFYMKTFFEGITEDYELTDGQEEFYITKYEVYQLYLN